MTDQLRKYKFIALGTQLNQLNQLVITHFFTFSIQQSKSFLFYKSDCIEKKVQLKSLFGYFRPVVSKTATKKKRETDRLVGLLVDNFIQHQLVHCLAPESKKITIENAKDNTLKKT
mgnify:CR=1 FL=1